VKKMLGELRQPNFRVLQTLSRAVNKPGQMKQTQAAKLIRSLAESTSPNATILQNSKCSAMESSWGPWKCVVVV